MVNVRKLKKAIFNKATLQKSVGIIGFFFLWYVLSALKAPFIGGVPSPVEVADAFVKQLGLGVGGAPAAGSTYGGIAAVLGTTFGLPKYYISVAFSFYRVFAGFLIASIVGIPLGLMMGWSKTFNELTFPIFEVLRPIPPIAWIPMSIILFPTEQQSIIFITFIGAFFCIVVNTILGVQSIDLNLKRAALSLGARPKDVFRYVVVPGSLPAILTGMDIAIGITWVVVVAAEMIAGGIGLGYMTWSAYIGGVFPVIVVGMISIGLVGYASSGLLRYVGHIMMPWRRLF